MLVIPPLFHDEELVYEFQKKIELFKVFLENRTPL